MKKSVLISIIVGAVIFVAIILVLLFGGHEHSWSEWQTAKKASCTENGINIRVCDKCGESQSIDVYAKGHTWGNWTTTQEATCTKNGVKTRLCDECGESQSDDISAKGHTWENWTTTKEATCTENGSQERVCNCGEKETQIIYARGYHVFTWTTTQEATCTESGSKDGVCDCGEERSEVIASQGHNMVEATCTADSYCTNCNFCEYGSATGHNYVNDICTTCGEAGVAEITWGNSGDLWVEYYYLYSDGTYTPRGGGYLYPISAVYDDRSFYDNGGRLNFVLLGQRDGNLFFKYKITDQNGYVVKSGDISAGYVEYGEVYFFDYYIGKLSPGEYTITFTSKNGLE